MPEIKEGDSNQVCLAKTALNLTEVLEVIGQTVPATVPHYLVALKEYAGEVLSDYDDDDEPIFADKQAAEEYLAERPNVPFFLQPPPPPVKVTINEDGGALVENINEFPGIPETQCYDGAPAAPQLEPLNDFDREMLTRIMEDIIDCFGRGVEPRLRRFSSAQEVQEVYRLRHILDSRRDR